MEDKIFIRKESKCPCCNRPLTAEAGPEEPRPGDFSVCLHCGNALIFNENRILQPFSDSEMEKLKIEDYPSYCELKSNIEMVKQYRHTLN